MPKLRYLRLAHRLAESESSPRGLMRLLLSAPIVLLILLASSHLALLRDTTPAFADTLSKLRADYSPWMYVVIRPVKPQIIEERIRDQEEFPEVYDQRVGTAVVPGSVWTVPLDPTPQTPAPTAEPSGAPSAVPSPTATPLPPSGPTETATPGPLPVTQEATHSPTPSVLPSSTSTPSATATSTTTHTPSRTPTRTPTPTATPPSILWWDTGYRYRRRITVAAGSVAVPSAYSVTLTFDHAALVSAGKSLSNGNDIRILRLSGSMWSQLDRALDPQSSWNSGNTRLWFRVVNPIGASSADSNYFLYYGNPSAGSAPRDWAGVFLLGDEFNDGSLTGGLRAMTSGAATIVEAGGEAAINGGSANSDAGILVGTNPLAGDRQFAIRHKVMHVSGDTLNPEGCCNPEAKFLGIVQSSGIPAVADSETENPRRRIMIFHRSYETGDALHDLETWIFYATASGGSMYWNGSSWIAGQGSWTTLPMNTYFICELHSTGSTWYVRVRDAGGSTLTTTSTVPWSDVLNTGEPLWFYWGEVYNNAYWGDTRSDWVLMRDLVEPEPTTSLGAEEPY